jgi:hypothetical protein
MGLVVVSGKLSLEVCRVDDFMCVHGPRFSKAIGKENVDWLAVWTSREWTRKVGQGEIPPHPKTELT